MFNRQAFEVRPVAFKKHNILCHGNHNYKYPDQHTGAVTTVTTVDI